jgi:integrating conjugative element membrane protein (TIGR03747 family)
MEESNNNNRTAQEPKGFIPNLVNMLLKILGLLIFTALLAIIIEWIGISFFYPDEGYKHSQDMLQQDITHLNNTILDNAMNEGSVKIAKARISDIVKSLFFDTKMIEKMNAFKERKHKEGKQTDGIFSQLIKELVNEYYIYFMSAIYVLISFIIRLSILILSIPAFVLFGLVGVADGLMQRDLRRWSAGNESAYIYHWAKRFSLPMLVISWVIYLSLPYSMHPNYIITPFAVLFGISVLVMASKFKKYL